ncbi:MAG TPA: hypothetical protein VEZ52_11485 [Desulfovibrio sp.]|uniref:hypothetical protein n=1 Tax=Desulfovibrio sp. TaxID=885 RepID=UPI002D52F5C1|nr:hypothetical protein [Desulfovibrio sp.]HZF62229.1 hypothetical protein [Desulfovibrio sp.]
MKQVFIKFAKFMMRQLVFYRFIHGISICLPHCRITDYERFPFLLKVFYALSGHMRNSVNLFCSSDREHCVHYSLLPTIRILFEKNYVNYAQILLFVCEEYFLSKRTEKDFEDVLKTFSDSAINAGKRFREAFPLQKSSGSRVSFVSPYVAYSGYEVILGLGKSLARFKPRMTCLGAFDVRGQIKISDLFKICGYEYIEAHSSTYNLFTLRNLVQKEKISCAIWCLPPFHMFFLFSFGLAEKQIWLSQYLRPNINFEYLDDVVTYGGAGTIFSKNFNEKTWKVLPQTSVIDGINLNPKKYLFTPARTEKIKQPEFLQCVTKILKMDKSTHFLWTGYHFDREIDQFFCDNGLSDRNSYIPWMDQIQLMMAIRFSSLILSCFPLSLGTVEEIAAYYKVPIVSMYDDEFNLYWRDIYWEALNGNEYLKKICIDDDGISKIFVCNNSDDYVAAALSILTNEKIREQYINVYYESYMYTYINNNNDLSGFFESLINGGSCEMVKEG